MIVYRIIIAVCILGDFRITIPLFRLIGHLIARCGYTIVDYPLVIIVCIILKLPLLYYYTVINGVVGCTGKNAVTAFAGFGGELICAIGKQLHLPQLTGAVVKGLLHYGGILRRGIVFHRQIQAAVHGFYFVIAVGVKLKIPLLGSIAVHCPLMDYCPAVIGRTLYVRIFFCRLVFKIVCTVLKLGNHNGHAVPFIALLAAHGYYGSAGGYRAKQTVVYRYNACVA